MVVAISAYHLAGKGPRCTFAGQCHWCKRVQSGAGERCFRHDASAYINDALGEADTNIIIGCATDENAGDEIRITVIATGIEGNAAPKVVQGGQANMATVRPQQRPAQQPQQPSHSGLNYQKQALAEEHAMPRMRMPRTVGNFSDEERIVPTFLRDRDQLSKQTTHNPGREEFIFEEEEIELPTFIRKQAN